MSASERGIPVKRAARALGVGRKSVLVMVERGQLERAADGGIAPLSLVRAVAEPGARALTERSNALPHAPERPSPLPETPEHPSALSNAPAPPAPPSPPDAARAFRELVEPMLQQLVDARGEAAGLRARLAVVDQHARQSRQKDELLAALVAGTWRERRRARRAALSLLAHGRG